MCGIAGYFGYTNRERAEHCVRGMTESLAQRGPDAAGFDAWPGAILGHRRLSIFDLSEAGRQPMVTRDRSLAVTFNGAIYNFRDLRPELEAAGYEFHSNTDTEVLLHGYRQWGIDGLVARLRGMFAFGLWDDRAAKGFLVRDRLGVKPLLWAPTSEGGLGFASSARALRDGGLVSEIDEQAVLEFLEFGYVTDSRSIYAGVKKLSAATILEWSDGKISERCYWKLPEARRSGGPTFDEAVEETERLFLEAVKLRLDADVPVGSLLSGGIDSSLVCWAVSKLGGNITSFTVSTPGDPLDETADAARTAQELGIDHRIIELDGEQPPEMDELVSAYGEPFACSSALGMLRVSRAVKPSATVLLTGDGGDDIFLGYPEHRNFWRAAQIGSRLPETAARAWNRWRNRREAAAGRLVAPLRRAVRALDYASGGLGAIACAHDGLPYFERHGLLGERLARRSVVQRSIGWSPAAGRRVLDDFLVFDRETRFVGEYLTKVDGGAMRYALEARSPFLDQEIWNFAAALPFDLRLRGGKLKAILREFARRRVSPRVAGGRKRGFGIPAQRWMVGRWRTLCDDAFHDSLIARQGWVNQGSLRSAWKTAVARGQAPVQLWYLLVLDAWLRRERNAQPDTDLAAPGVGVR